MDIILAITVCAAIIAAGELVSYFTKAFVPSMAAALFIYLLLTWAGMTKDFPDISGFNYLGEMSMLFLTVHMGTTVVPGDWLKNYKTLIIAIGAIFCGLVMVVGVGGIFFGFDTMLGAAGATCGGGALGAILSMNKLTEVGLAPLAAIPAIIMSVCDFYGQPITAFMLKKYTRKLSKEDAYLVEAAILKEKEEKNEIRLTKHGVPFGSEDNPSNRITAWIPQRLESDGLVLLEIAGISLISYYLDSLTGINMCVFAFFLAIAGCALGFLRMNLLDRSHSAGLVFAIFLVWIFAGLNSVTPQSLLDGLAPAVAALILATIGLAAGGGIIGKLLGYDFWLMASCGMGIMYLSPGVLFVTNEVCSKNSRNEEEEKFFKKKISPHMYMAANAGYIITVAVTVSLLLPMLAR